MNIQKLFTNKKIITWIVIILVVIGAAYLVNKAFFSSNSNNTQPSASPTPSQPLTEEEQYLQLVSGKYAVIETDKGYIGLELFPDSAPKTVINFAKLISNGFYNGLKFHRVVPGFVIQGGDPNGDGTGGPGYLFEDEINPWSLGLSNEAIAALQAEGYKYTRDLQSVKMTEGALAMANAGPNTNGSQFFIVTDSDQPHLEGRHTVFGHVIESMDVVRKIKQGDIIKKIFFIDKFSWSAYKDANQDIK